MARKLAWLILGVLVVCMVVTTLSNQNVTATSLPPLPTVTPPPTLELSPVAPASTQPTIKYYDYSRSDWGANPAWSSLKNVYAPTGYQAISPDLDSGKRYNLKIQPGQLLAVPDPPQIPTGITIHSTETLNDPACRQDRTATTLRAIQADHALHAFGHIPWSSGNPDPRSETSNHDGPVDSTSGDIGYHFLVDCAGRVWEGRAGGIYQAGQHVHRHNNGQIGIALLGSFEHQNVPPAQRAALVKLLFRLCRDLNINPLDPWQELLLNGTTKILSKNGRVVLAVAGHSEFPDNDHSDPGRGLDLDQLRQDVAKELKRG